MGVRTVITGGPGTGKTALILELERQGYFCFHEIIREMTLEAKQKETEALVNPLAFVKDPLAFNRMLLHQRIKQFEEAGRLQVSPLFYDRGIPDVLAYMDYFNQGYDLEFTEPCERLRYDLVVLLPPGKRFTDRTMNGWNVLKKLVKFTNPWKPSIGNLAIRLKP